MSAKIAVAVLVLLNGALVIRSWGLSCPRSVEEAAAFRKEAARREVERARLAAKVAVLEDALRRLETPNPHSPPPGQEARDAAIDPRIAALLEEVGITEKPDPLKIPLLAPEEREDLDRVWAALPPLGDSAIIARDLDALLADLAWNPTGRKLGPAERLEAENLIRDYCYFDRISLAESTRTLVEPMVPRMKELGAFVEYDLDSGLPPIEGNPVTHAETDGSGKFKMYFFYPEEHPDLHHHRQVSDEQTWLTFVKLYQLVSGEEP